MTYPPPPPPNYQNKSSTGKIVVAIIVIVVIIVSISVAVSLLPGVSGPNPQITMSQGREGLSGLNYVYYVDATVVNNGASGYVTVYGEINGAGRNEQQNTGVYLERGESKTVTLTFDISILGSLSQPSINYEVWATAG